MNALKKKFSILLSENDPDYQFLCQIAISEIDPGIELNTLYSGEQLIHFLLKEKIERDLNRQHLPHLIIAHYNPPHFSFDDIKLLKSNDRCANIPLVLLVDEAGSEFKKLAAQMGVKEVVLRPYTFLELKEILNGFIVRNPIKRLTKALFCCRCEDFVGYDNEREMFTRNVRLSQAENDFIRARFSGPLCVPCINQLRTSFRIIHGDFDRGDNSRVHKKIL